MKTMRFVLQHIEKILKHKELETQLYDAKLAQATLQLNEEKERNLHEKQQVNRSNFSLSDNRSA